MVTVSSLSSCIRTVTISDFHFMKMETHLNINKAKADRAVEILVGQQRILKARLCVKCVALLLQPSCIALYGLEILSFGSLVSAEKKQNSKRKRKCSRKDSEVFLCTLVQFFCHLCCH